jgi:hypothetical protein
MGMLATVGNVLATMYWDLVSSTRATQTVTTYGATELVQVAMLANVRCKLSFGSSPDKPYKPSISENLPQMQPKVFCASGTDILKGDYLKITRRDDDGVVLGTYEGTAGAVSKFGSHIEVLIDFVGNV